MKYILTVLLTSYGSLLFAQNGLKFERTLAVQNFDQSSFFSKLEKNIDGSVYLYKSWNSNATVYTRDGMKLILGHINFNIKDDVFQSKISEDSLFTFKLVNLNKVILNKKVYKNLFANGNNKIYEVIYESDNLSIYKAYNVELIPASDDPMAGRSNSKYSQKSSYFLNKSKAFTSIRLTKKNVLKLFDDKEKVSKVQTFVKKNKLSYKKEKDIVKILNFATHN